MGKSERIVRAAERLSLAVGHACSWTIGILMVLVCVEVVKRYAINMPSDWALDVFCMLYGTCFLMCGAYALSQDAHVRGDFVYGRLKPRTQAALDLVLYFLFFLPGILALAIAGWEFASDSWTIMERSSVAANGPYVFPYKSVIPIAAFLVLLQGVAEILRCVACLRDGEWPARLNDAREEDVIAEQLEHSGIDEEELKRAERAVELERGEVK
jgi:TRAP-type mannitol/chloroaromatic compound transport system permease small subunit